MDWQFEEAWKGMILAGCDEAGRGPLAGPVVAASVILPFGTAVDGVNDSKKLSEKKRAALYDVIAQKAIAYCICEVSSDEIDQLNIHNATLLCMKKSILGLKIKPDIVLVDGKFAPNVDIGTKAIVKGDTLSVSIAAASILAKVARDRLMVEYDGCYPFYGFAKHKGYPTKQHYDAIEKHGITPIHRLSYRLEK